jgi:protein-disulfide isomerase
MPRTDEPEDLAGSGARRQPIRPLAIVAVSTLVLLAAAIAIAAAGGSSTVLAGTSQEMPAEEVDALLAGLPESENSLGSATAPLTLQFFGDLECPTARDFTLEVLPQVIRKWVRPGEMRIEYRSLRSVSEPKAFDAQQVAALAAGMQDKLWYYVEYFYREQGLENSGYVTESYLSALARQISSLNIEAWRSDRSDPQLAAQITEDERVAQAMHLRGTPSFLVGRTGSVPIFGMGEHSTIKDIDYAAWKVLHG